MKRVSLNFIRAAVAFGVMSVASIGFAQDVQQQGPPPDQARQNEYPNGNQPNGYAPSAQQDYQVPAQLTVRPGTFITVRVNQPLSSDRNQAGDAFSATLVQPLVVDGVVVAQRGQTLTGRVAEAQKAGRVSGTSRLGIQLTELTLVDGQQFPLQSQMINRTGPTSVGRDVGAIAGTTALGAAIGAGADWGRGAAIGAGAGAVVGTLGVLLTRGHPTIIHPESVLTFRIDSPLVISTARAPQAFRYVDTNEYSQPAPAPSYRAYGPSEAPVYGYAAPYPYYGYGYGYSPYYWGPSIGFGFGYRGYYRGGFYGGRGFGGHGYRR